MMDWTGVAKDLKRRQKKALKLHNYCIIDLQEACEPQMISAWIEESMGSTNKERRVYLFGRVRVVVKAMILHYHGSSMLDINQFDVDKKVIRMRPNEHPDEIFNQMYMVKKKYAHRQDMQISEQSWVGLVINGCTELYRPVFLTTYSQNKHLPPSVIPKKLKEIANENYASMVKSKETVSDLVVLDEVGLFSGMGHTSAKDKCRKG